MARGRFGTDLFLLAAFFMVSALPASAALKLIVLPLDNLSRNSSLAWLSDGVAISISDELRGDDVEVIDRDRRAPLVESLDLPPNAPLSRASMIRVAQEAGADWLLMGSYSGTPEKIQVALRLLEMRTMKLGGKILAEGPLKLLPDMENDLAWNVLGGMRIVTSVKREDFGKRIRAVPNSAYAPYVRSLGVVEEEDQAKLLSDAVQEYADFPAAQFLLGRYYFQKGDCSRAAGALEIALRRQGSYVESQFMIGTCALREENPDRAILAYDHLLAVRKSHEASNNIAIAYLRKGEYPMAIQNLLEARALSAGNLTIGLNLAILRHLQGNDAAAGEVVDEAIRSHPNNGMLQYLRSVILGALGDQQGAAAALDRAKALGADVNKLRAQEPKSWARVFATWEPRS